MTSNSNRQNVRGIQSALQFLAEKIRKAQDNRDRFELERLKRKRDGAIKQLQKLQHTGR